MVTTATLIHSVVHDLLCQNKFAYAHFPEIVDLAVVGTGLGVPQSNIDFVKNVATFWDSTNWEVAPRPFLDCHSLAWANAVAAWIRGDKDPDWARDLPGEVSAPMRKSLKYLFKTNDSILQSSIAENPVPVHSQADWMKLAREKSVTTQIISLRHLEFAESADSQQEILLVEKFRSGNREILLHAIDATQRMKIVSEPLAEELRFLLDNRDDEVRAKALYSLTRSRQLDERAIDAAAKMLESRTRYVVFAGIVALSSLDTVPDHVLPAADRGFVRALQKCDFEFVGLFAQAYNRWLDDPRAHFNQLFGADSPEYFGIALEALKNVREQLVTLG